MAEGRNADREVHPLTCAICLESYKTPKFLPCFHSFCESCLDGYIKSSAIDRTFKCPLCLEKCSVPKNGVKDLVTNFYVGAVEGIGQIKENTHCDVCGPDVIAEQMCLECDENFCGPCVKTHSKMKLTKDHKVCAIFGARGDNHVKSKFYCSRHPDVEVEVTCKECRKATKPEPIKTYNVEHTRDISLQVSGYVYGIVPIGNNKLWVGISGHPEVLLMDIEGTILQSVPIGAGSSCVTGDGQGNCIATSFSGKFIKRVKRSGIVETIITNVEALIGVACRKIGNMEEIFCICTLDGKRWVGKLDNQQPVKISKVLQLDGAKHLATDHKIERGLLCTSATSAKQIVVFKSDGETVCKYKRGQEDFNPNSGTCFDNQGCVIVADYGGDSILRINTEGELIQVLVKDLSPLEVVAVDDQNNLLVGLKGQIKVYKLT